MTTEGEARRSTVPASSVRMLRLAAVVAVVAIAAVVVMSSGIIGHVSDAERLQATVEDAGVWGPVLFLVLMVLLVPLNVPGLLFVIPATTLFGTVAGVVLSLVGGFVASAIGVVAARRLGRSAFEARMPARIRRIETEVSRRGFWAVVLLRSFTFLLQPVDWLCGLSSMRMRTVLAATFVGLIPSTLFVALSGGGVLDLVL